MLKMLLRFVLVKLATMLYKTKKIRLTADFLILLSNNAVIITISIVGTLTVKALHLSCSHIFFPYHITYILVVLIIVLTIHTGFTLHNNHSFYSADEVSELSVEVSSVVVSSVAEDVPSSLEEPPRRSSIEGISPAFSPKISAIVKSS